MNKQFYTFALSALFFYGHTAFASSLELTGEDYTHVMNTVGMGASAGTITPFEKNGQKFEWTFHAAAVPFPKNGHIGLLEENPDGTQMTFQVIAPARYPASHFHCEFTLRTLTEDASNILQIDNLPPSKPGSIRYFKEKFGIYPPPTAQRFKYESFVLVTLDPQYGYEGDRADNTPTKKEDCQLTINNGVLYGKNGDLFSTHIPAKAFNDNGIFLWVLGKKGTLYTTTMYGDISQAAIGNQHSFFEKKDGFGKPIAGGGHIKAENGKITELDPASGHYKPNDDQFLLCLHYLYQQGVLSNNFIGNNTFLKETYTLKDIASIDPDEILARYKEL